MIGKRVKLRYGNEFQRRNSSGLVLATFTYREQDYAVVAWEGCDTPKVHFANNVEEIERTTGAFWL